MRSQEVMGKTKRQVSSPRVTTMPPSTKSRKVGGTMTRPLSSTLYWNSPNGIVSLAPVGPWVRRACDPDVIHDVLHAQTAPPNGGMTNSTTVSHDFPQPISFTGKK